MKIEEYHYDKLKVVALRALSLIYPALTAWADEVEEGMQYHEKPQLTPAAIGVKESDIHAPPTPPRKIGH